MLTNTLKSLLFWISIGLTCQLVFTPELGQAERIAHFALSDRISKVDKLIGAVERRMDSRRRLRLAHAISYYSEQYNLDPKVLIAIIDTESDFRTTMISTTGDISLAQINPRVWNKELKRIGKARLNIKRLKTDDVYAIERMAEILSVIKQRHAKRDRNWYCRYHSNTHRFKSRYLRKLKRKFRLMAKA